MSRWGRGGANVKTKMKNLKTGGVVEETIRSGEKFPTPELEEKKMQFLYMQDGLYYFMDQETYEQIPLTSGQLGDAKLFLKENTEVKILNYKGTPLNVELPMFIELAVAQTDPGYKGDTASGGGKPAKLETGLMLVQVPQFVDVGQKIKVDTRDGKYLEWA